MIVFMNILHTFPNSLIIEVWGMSFTLDLSTIWPSYPTLDAFNNISDNKPTCRHQEKTFLSIQHPGSVLRTTQTSWDADPPGAYSRRELSEGSGLCQNRRTWGRCWGRTMSRRSRRRQMGCCWPTPHAVSSPWTRRGKGPSGRTGRWKRRDKTGIRIDKKTDSWRTSSC